MLITKSNFDDGDIVSIKLTNGDEIVARIKSHDDDGYCFDSPCLVVPAEQGIGLMNAMFSCEPDISVTVKNIHIMMMAPAHHKMQQHYIKSTTGIIT